MKLLIIGLSLAYVVFFGLAAVSPKTDNYPPAVTEHSSITYQLDEKVKVAPYGAYNEWYDGKIVGITSEDDYIVDFCGHIGWFNKWECSRDNVKRSELAKVKQ